jgi:hypothetical protein
MKPCVALLVLITVGAVSFSFINLRSARSQQAALAAARAELQEKTRQIEDLQVTQKRFDQQRAELIRLTQEMGTALQAGARASTSAPPVAAEAPASADSGSAGPEKGGFGKMLANMMQDPEMRKFIRDQQRATMNQLYGPLVKSLGMTPEEGEKFKDLLAESAMNLTEKASSLFGGTKTNSTEAVERLGAEQKGFEQAVREFLGEDRYAQYQEYQQTVGERALLEQFRQQTAGSDHPLTPQQTDALLAVMKEEKQNLPAMAGLGGAQNSGNVQALFSEEQTQKLLEAQETVNQRVYQRAGQILAPEQMESFGRFQTNQAQMMRLGLSMARKMISPEAPK